VSPLDGVNGVRRSLLARIGLPEGCRVDGSTGSACCGAHNAPAATVLMASAEGLVLGYFIRSRARCGHQCWERTP
jgi:hypothetical protein